MLRLAHPNFLFLLILIIPIIFFGQKGGGRIRFSSIEILKSITKYRNFHPRLLLLLLRVIVFTLFIIALSRPQSGKKFREVTSEGVDILLAIDTSGSMQALDFKREGKHVDRLSIVKEVVSAFIKRRPGDRMGLVVFGEEAFTQCPLTLDHGILMEFLSKLEIGMSGQATAVGSAIGVSINRIKDVKSKTKIIILLTDGRSNAGRIPPLKAAELARTFNIKVYTIGVGTEGKAPFLVDTIFGKRYQYQEVDLDEKSLKEIAAIAGGKYYRATNTEKLREIYDEIDQLEKTKIKVKEYTEYNEQFHLFLLWGIVLLLLEIFLGQTYLRKIP